MKASLFSFLIFFGVAAKATNYYIDPSSITTNEKGTISEPWKGFEPLYKVMAALKPGDSILLKRGELFFEKLDLTCSGTENAPIVVTAYGRGNSMPVFMHKPPLNEKILVEEYAIRINKCSYLKFEGLEITDDHIDPLNHSAEALIKIAFAIQESNFISIQNCHVSLVGIAVNIIGNNNLVDHCKIKNLRMVRNTQNQQNDDYGANGVVIAGNDNTISNCSFTDCWATSYDFEFDGGTIEMMGPSCNRNKIIKNFAFNCNGFMEFGSSEAGNIDSNYISENLVLNCADLLYINNDGPFAVKVQNLELINNIFIQLSPQLTKPTSMIAMRKKAEDKNIIILRDNIFWLPMEIDVTRAAQFEGDELIHTNNIYYLRGGKLNFSLDRSERILAASSEIFKNLLKQPFFQNIDLYPFIYLIKYLYLII